MIKFRLNAPNCFSSPNRWLLLRHASSLLTESWHKVFFCFRNVIHSITSLIDNTNVFVGFILFFNRFHNAEDVGWRRVMLSTTVFPRLKRIDLFVIRIDVLFLLIVLFWFLDVWLKITPIIFFQMSYTLINSFATFSLQNVIVLILFSFWLQFMSRNVQFVCLILFHILFLEFEC